MISFAAAVVVMLALIWAVITSAVAGPGMGEVSVILHGGFILLGILLAAFFALICVMIGFWHWRRMRIGLLIVTGGTIGVVALWIGYSAVTGYLSERAYDRQRAAQAEQDAARDAVLTPIAFRYYAQLVSGTLNAQQIASLRPAFEQEIAAFEFPRTQAADASTYFLSAHDIYMRLFLEGEDHVPAHLGYYNASACLHIETDLADRMNVTQQAEFGEMCPDWLMDYVR